MTHRFIEALNARDEEELEQLVADDAEFTTPAGTALRGHDAVEKIVRAADDAGVMIVRAAGQPIEETVDGVLRLALPVNVTVHKSNLHGTAHFELRDGKVTRFRVVTDDA